MILCKIETVSFDETAQMGIVLLVEENGERAVPIWVGIFETQAIMIKMKETHFPRPLTHDLLKSCMEKLGGKVEYVLINDIMDNTFYAQIHIAKDDKKDIIDSRPSDAIALAVRVNAPIYVNEKVFELSGVNKENFLKEQKEKLYLSYLESLEDDDMGKLKH